MFEWEGKQYELIVECNSENKALKAGVAKVTSKA